MIPDLCISMVSGGDPQMTLRSLESLLQSLSGKLSCQIYFIDNASPDDWFKDVPARFPSVIMRKNTSRRGFAANHNSVMQSVEAKYYLLLNDDTHVHPHCCEELVKAAEAQGRVGFLGAKLLNSDGSVQPSVFRFPSPSLALKQAFLLNHLLGHLSWFDEYKSFAYDTPRLVDFASGAALLARGTMLKEIGLLDEQFYMYAEETDWCLRAKKAGWLTAFVPTAVVTHYGGQSTLHLRKERSIEFLRSHEKLLRKHFGKSGLFCYKAFNLLKHLPRAAVASICNWPEPQRQAEFDSALWSIGLLSGNGLSELAQEAAVPRSNTCLSKPS